MIRQIDASELNIIDQIISRFREQISVPENFADQIRDAVQNDRACLYGYFAEDGSLKGLVLFGKVSRRISFAFADGNLEIEKDLVSTIFDRFSGEVSYMITGGPWMSDAMSQHVVDIGFKEFRRAYMTLPRTDLESLDEPSLPEEMQFEIYTPEMKEEIADLMFKGNDGHVDQALFPDFFESLEACRRLIDNIVANRYGDYKESSSWILRESSRAIGVCFMTIRNGDSGYIPDIVIDPAYRRRGLGRAIQVQSMKRQIESESSLKKVDLDVTLSNKARFLYDSLGFKTVSEYTMYTWRK